jgi:hypothetical protein
LNSHLILSSPFFALGLCLLIFLFFFAPFPSQGETMTRHSPVLPKTVELWTGPDSPKVVTAKTIFDYMNGAGELYLGYRFDRLDVYEYKAQSQKDILVELYFMKSSDDAFGLLSLDWGGESIDLNPSIPDEDPDGVVWPRALYGQGLLRLWSENLYARVMATQETAESRRAVLSIGEAIVKGRNNPPGPDLTKGLKMILIQDWHLRRDRIRFFRTHLVLNSVYYLSHQNILDLDLACDAVMALYEKKGSSRERIRIPYLWIKYPEPQKAQTALSRFHQGYLPEHALKTKTGLDGKFQSAFEVEDGWMAYECQDESISLVFECPDEETARAILDQME